MAVFLTNTANVATGTGPGADPSALLTFVSNGITHLLSANGSNGTLSNFVVSGGGGLNVSGAPVPAGSAPSGLTVATVEGQPVICVTNFGNDTIGRYRISPIGNLVADGGLTSTTDPTSVAAINVGGNTYLYVGSPTQDTISGFALTLPLPPAALPGLPVSDGGLLELNGVRSLATAVVGSVPYLFAAGADDDGLSVFQVNANGSLTNKANVTDNATLALNGAFSVKTAVVAGTTYLFASGYDDDGISVFRVNAGGSLTNVDNVFDGESATLELNGVIALSTTTLAGKTYLFAGSQVDDGVSVFTVAANGTLTNVANISDNASLKLNAIAAVHSAVIGGSVYFFAAGLDDDGVSAFRIRDNSGNQTYVVDDFDDVVDESGGDGVDTVSSSILFSLSDTVHVKGDVENLTLTSGGDLSGTGNALANTIIGNVGVNILDGLDGNDRLTGGANADSFVFSFKPNKKTNVDHITDFLPGTDSIVLDASAFKKLKPGDLKKKAFFAKKGAEKAKDDKDRIIYDKKSGALSWDKDGKGGDKAKVFAILDGSPDTLKAADFTIVA